MRPVASTAVASMQKIAAPDSASELMWVKCQSLASPSCEEYWHIGATMMRLASVKPRKAIGENRALMEGVSDWMDKGERTDRASMLLCEAPAKHIPHSGRAAAQPGTTKLLRDARGLDHL